MSIILFYVLACLLMGLSTMLTGLQWSEANGVSEYLELLLDKPFIILVTVIIFISSGILMQTGKFHFGLSYYKISITWFATSWVALTILWILYDIKPSRAELIGVLLCHIGLAISILGRSEPGPLS